MFENITETQKLQEIIFSANVFVLNRDIKMFGICVCVHTYVWILSFLTYSVFHQVSI